MPGKSDRNRNEIQLLGNGYNIPWSLHFEMTLRKGFASCYLLLIFTWAICFVIYRDRTEKLAELSEEKKKEIQQKENIRWCFFWWISRSIWVPCKFDILMKIVSPISNWGTYSVCLVDCPQLIRLGKGFYDLPLRGFKDIHQQPWLTHLVDTSHIKLLTWPHKSICSI